MDPFEMWWFLKIEAGNTTPSYPTQDTLEPLPTTVLPNRFATWKAPQTEFYPIWEHDSEDPGSEEDARGEESGGATK